MAQSSVSAFRRIALLGAAALMAATLAGCTGSDLTKATKPLSTAMKKRIALKGMDEKSPILVRIFKEESVLEVWKKEKTGRYALLKSYDICKWSGRLGPKVKEGDRQAPEGFYTVHPAQMNPNSQFHLSFNMGFPNAYDQAWGRTGKHLMVHGACSSSGCYSMGDDSIQEVYTLARLAFAGGQRAFQVQAYPFRMTPQNLAKHRKSEHYAFWKELKAGYDLFEVTRQQPQVAVCSKKYAFGAEAQPGVSYSPSGSCEGLSMPESVRLALTQRSAQDEAAEAQVAARFDERDYAKVAVADLMRDPKQKNEIPPTLLALTAPESPLSAGAAAAQAMSQPGEEAAAEAGPPATETAEAPVAESSAEEGGGMLSRLIEKVW